MSATLFNSLFRDDRIAQQFADEQFIAYMLAFEVALAQVQSRLGVIPELAGDHIATVVQSFRYDLAAIQAGVEKSSIPTIELVKQVRQAVGDDYGSYVHWGTTSQDVMDTVLVLQLRACITHLEADLHTTIQHLAVLANQHRHTLMAGRTHSQQALPITFGFKVANWIAPLLRHQQRLDELKPRLLMVQLGGAVGTLASLGDDGIAVQEGLAHQLGLGVPLIAWHNQRDTLAEFAGWLSLVTGSLAKMAQDIILMAQSEIGELLESDDPSRGGSSTMPQKRNPVISEIIVASARHNASLLGSMHTAMIHEHERATGNWQLEWITLPQMLHATAVAINKALFLSQHLVVNVKHMQSNVEAAQGMMLAEAVDLALAPHIGRTQSKQLVKTCVAIAIEDDRHLVDVVQEQVKIDINWYELRQESNYLGQADVFIDRILADVN